MQLLEGFVFLGIYVICVWYGHYFIKRFHIKRFDMGFTSGKPHTHTHWKIFLWQPLHPSLSLHPPFLSLHTPLSAPVVQECMHLDGRKMRWTEGVSRACDILWESSASASEHTSTEIHTFHAVGLHQHVQQSASVNFQVQTVHTFSLTSCIFLKSLLRIKSQSHRRTCVKSIFLSVKQFSLM